MTTGQYNLEKTQRGQSPSSTNPFPRGEGGPNEVRKSGSEEEFGWKPSS